MTVVQLPVLREHDVAVALPVVYPHSRIRANFFTLKAIPFIRLYISSPSTGTLVGNKCTWHSLSS